jgi:tetratricopeptide (TPR) repeat protein
LLERLDRLDRNAKGFMAVRKVLLAMKCYETMALIRPDDPVALHNFGMCLKKIGKLDLAEKVLERAKKLAQ